MPLRWRVSCTTRVPVACCDVYAASKCLVSVPPERYCVALMTSAEAKSAGGPGPRDIIGLALASAAVLALQVTATRLFSFLVWYHFAFLVLSIAFLGFTAGGMLVQSRRVAQRSLLTRLGLAGGLGTLGTFFALAHLPLEPHLLATWTAGLAFIGAVLVTLVPFVCLGAYVCLTLATWPEHISGLYAANMIGSALGCALVVFLLDLLGVPAAFLASGLMAFSAGICSMQPAPSRSRAWLVAGVSVCAWLALVYAATDALRPWVYMKSAKAFPHLPRELIAERHTDSLSSVDIYRNPFPLAAQTPTLWGISETCPQCPAPEIVGFAIDGWALTSVVRRSQVEGPNNVLTYLPAALPYRQHRADDTLIIGAGGGIDVLTALHYGAKHVVGVELNPIVLNAVKGRYAELAGHLYSDPRVEMHNAEGRHFLKREKRKFDLIQLSGVDTFAASQAGAFALHENYLYTVEALRDYLDALKPDGMLTFTRWLYVPERQTIRLAAMLDRVLRERGVAHPQNHFVVFSSDLFAVVMIKKTEFAPTEIEQLLADVAEKKFLPIYVPYRRVNPLKDKWGDNPFYQMWDVGPEKFVADYSLDIRPTTDDRPFFFEYQRWGRPLARDKVFKNQNAQVVLLETLTVCGVLCAAILMLARRRFRAVPVRLGVGAHLYFAALGLAYIFVENVLVQRMILCLGSPAYALTVILFTLLAASGLGSSLAVRWRLVQKRPQLTMLCVAGLLLAYSVWLRPLLDAVLAFELSTRIVIVVALISPLGFLMGMPFPLAIARLSRADSRLLPWAWVINGAASVLGGAITVMLAMSSGFDAVFWAAAALYLVAALSYGRLGWTRDVSRVTQAMTTAG